MTYIQIGLIAFVDRIIIPSIVFKESQENTWLLQCLLLMSSAFHVGNVNALYSLFFYFATDMFTRYYCLASEILSLSFLKVCVLNHLGMKCWLYQLQDGISVCVNVCFWFFLGRIINFVLSIDRSKKHVFLYSSWLAGWIF